MFPAENPRARTRYADLVRETEFRWTRWLLAQRESTREEDRVLRSARNQRIVRGAALGLTQKALAQELGVSARAIRHWLADPTSPDYRQIPDRLLVRLQYWNREKRAFLALRRREIEMTDDVEHYRPDSLQLVNIPLLMQRYERPRQHGIAYQRSEIFTVGTLGLSTQEIVYGLLPHYWKRLRRDGRNWTVRFLVEILVQDYFEGGVMDEEVARSIRQRAKMPFWVPPTGATEQKQFVYPGAIESSAIASQWAMLTGIARRGRLDEHKYGGRILRILKVSFAPYARDERTRQERARADRNSRRGRLGK